MFLSKNRLPAKIPYGYHWCAWYPPHFLLSQEICWAELSALWNWAHVFLLSSGYLTNIISIHCSSSSLRMNLYWGNIPNHNPESHPECRMGHLMVTLGLFPNLGCGSSSRLHLMVTDHPAKCTLLQNWWRSWSPSLDVEKALCYNCCSWSEYTFRRPLSKKNEIIPNKENVLYCQGKKSGKLRNHQSTLYTPW